MIRFIIFFLISFNVYSQNFQNYSVYKLDWLYDEAAIQVSYEMTRFSKIASSDKIALVIWDCELIDSFTTFRYFNEFAKKLKGKFQMIALGKNNSALIRRFKRQLRRDLIVPKDELEKFVKNFEFIVDLDQNIPQNILPNKIPALLILENFKVIKKLYSEQQIKDFIDKMIKKK